MAEGIKPLSSYIYFIFFYEPFLGLKQEVRKSLHYFRSFIKTMMQPFLYVIRPN